LTINASRTQKKFFNKTIEEIYANILHLLLI